jgi:hypothetical protein
MRIVQLISLLVLAACGTSGAEKQVIKRRAAHIPSAAGPVDRTKAEVPAKEKQGNTPDPTPSPSGEQSFSFDVRIADGDALVGDLLESFSIDQINYKKSLKIDLITDNKLDRFGAELIAPNSRTSISTDCNQENPQFVKCTVDFEVKDLNASKHEMILRLTATYQQQAKTVDFNIVLSPRNPCSSPAGPRKEGVVTYTNKFNAAQAINNDGSMLIASIEQEAANQTGKLVVEKFNCDGTRASDFSQASQVAIPLVFGRPIANGNVVIDEEPRINIKSDGKIVIDVLSWDLNANRQRLYRGVTVIQLMPSGQIDRSFGVDGTKIISSLNPPEQPQLLISFTAKITSSIDSQDRFLLSISDLRSDGGASAIMNTLVVRLTKLGAFDQAFGLGGFYSQESRSNQDSADRIIGITIDDVGRILTLTNQFASAQDNSRQRVFRTRLKRLTSSGAIDQSFGINGKVDLAECASEQVNGVRSHGRRLLVSRGAIYVACMSIKDLGQNNNLQSTESRLQVIKLSGDGVVDNAFGNNGRAILMTRNTTINAMESAKRETISAIAIDSQGRLWGTSLPEAGFTDRDVRVFRLSASGKLDESFGNGGVKTFIQVCSTRRAEMNIFGGTGIVIGMSDSSFYANPSCTITVR